jgi:hypothetical protein
MSAARGGKKNGRPEEGTRAVRGNEGNAPSQALPGRDMTFWVVAGTPSRCVEDYERGTRSRVTVNGRNLAAS